MPAQQVLRPRRYRVCLVALPPLPPESPVTRAGRAVEKVRVRELCRPNGSDVKLRGQGPRGYGRAARRLPAFELRDAGGVTPPTYR